jgi:hypothetical protein
MARLCETYTRFGGNGALHAFLIPFATTQISVVLAIGRCFMTPLTFEAQLNCDIQDLRSHFFFPAEILVTRWGEPADEWVSWDVDMMVPPEKMNAGALQLYGQLGVLLNHDPYRVMEEGITPDRIGYMVTSEASVC